MTAWFSSAEIVAHHRELAQRRHDGLLEGTV